MPACPSCNTDYAAGTRWCSICHTNVINPDIGRLSSPGKRLGAYLIDVLIPTGGSDLYFYFGQDCCENNRWVGG